MEIKVYGIHIRQENSLKALMNEEFIKLTASCGAVFVMNGKNPVRYLGSFILPTPAKQKEFADVLKKRGIKADVDTAPSYVDKAYVEKYLGSGWLNAEEKRLHLKKNG